MHKIKYTILVDGKERFVTLKGKPATGVIGMLHQYGYWNLEAGMELPDVGMVIHEVRE